MLYRWILWILIYSCSPDAVSSGLSPNLGLGCLVPASRRTCSLDALSSGLRPNLGFGCLVPASCRIASLGAGLPSCDGWLIGKDEDRADELKPVVGPAVICKLMGLHDCTSNLIVRQVSTPAAPALGTAPKPILGFINLISGRSVSYNNLTHGDWAHWPELQSQSMVQVAPRIVEDHHIIKLWPWGPLWCYSSRVITFGQVLLLPQRP